MWSSALLPRVSDMSVRISAMTSSSPGKKTSKALVYLRVEHGSQGLWPFWFASLSPCTHSTEQWQMTGCWPGNDSLLQRELEQRKGKERHCKEQQGTCPSLLQPFSISGNFFLFGSSSHCLLFFQKVVFVFFLSFSFTIKGLSTIFVVLISSGYRISGHCLESNTEILIRRWYIELKISNCHYLKLSSKNNFLIKPTKVNQKHIFLVNAILHEILIR